MMYSWIFFTDFPPLPFSPN